MSTTKEVSNIKHVIIYGHYQKAVSAQSNIQVSEYM